MGCGVCSHACENGAVRLVNVPESGIRPRVDATKCRECGRCLEACPGIHLPRPAGTAEIETLVAEWGPILEIWEGYAADAEIRYAGSSGGVATALALFCLEKLNHAGVLHTGADPDSVLENKGVLSNSREQLLAHTGSRYSPAAPCEALCLIRKGERDYTILGKPCDIAALRNVQAVGGESLGRIGLAISIFCAGTPATSGTYKLLEDLRIEPGDVAALRYRGCGWPGMTTARLKNDESFAPSMTYEQSWGQILSRHVQFRCRLCPDSTGEFADISCGDPWYRPIEPDEPGRSVVLVRTETGRSIFKQCLEAGYVEAQRATTGVLNASQKSLLNKRRNLYGRLLAMKLVGIPTPDYSGFPLRENWRGLPMRGRMRSIGGTIKRIVQRGWMKRSNGERE